MENKKPSADIAGSGLTAFPAFVIGLCMRNKFIVFALLVLLIAAGVFTAPFDWDIKGVSRSPVPVDAIPDIGENQQIVFTEWPGRSPKDIEDQVTYPLSVALMGMPGVKTVRSISMFGFSSIYVIFKDGVDFYWARSRILEKLNSLSLNLLPQNVKPALGPDATALGQVFWYTIEGRDEHGKPCGGWDPDELRRVQDWIVKYSLLAVDGVSEVASIGGYVKEYQVDVDPDALRNYGVSLEEVYKAVKDSNIDVGGRTMELNNVEYTIRGLGYVKSVSDIENSVVKTRENVPVYVKTVAKVSLGPAQRTGLLDKDSVDAVGGVVTVRYGENPLKVINSVKKEIAHISESLPSRKLADGSTSKLAIVPFYDRSGLIRETLGTLNSAIAEELIISIVVILIMISRINMAAIVSGMLPVSVLLCFIIMKLFKVDANIVALSGIAIAIGVVADMGIIMCENIIKRLHEASREESKFKVIYNAAVEISGALLTAGATTIISFLPVFALEGAEGKLFIPLAFTKTFTISAALLLAIIAVPPLAYVFLRFDSPVKKRVSDILFAFAALLIIVLGIWRGWSFGWIALLIPFYWFLLRVLRGKSAQIFSGWTNVFIALLLAVYLAFLWMPLGADAGLLRNSVWVLTPVVFLLAFFKLIENFYQRILGFFLRHKKIFNMLSISLLVLGFVSWQGIGFIGRLLPEKIKTSDAFAKVHKVFPGLGREFMPSLDEGSFLFMPTLMPHASVSEIRDVLRKQDAAIASVPEVSGVLGKSGRVESALDPAPLSMIETIINYKSKFLNDVHGRPLNFKISPDRIDYFRAPDGTPLNAPDGKPYFVNGEFLRDADGHLIPDESGRPFRLWRAPLDPALNSGRSAWSGISSSDDIWREIVSSALMPGVTSAPNLQPIQARIIMLQSGMRAAMGVVVKAPDLKALEDALSLIEMELKQVPELEAQTVIADRISGRPYLEIEFDRIALARYGVMVDEVQNIIETAIGGKEAGTTVEGRERYSMRVRYLRELRDSPEQLGRIMVTASDGTQVPLSQLASIHYRRGPESIKGENSFLVGYLFFDKKSEVSETDAVEAAAAFLKGKFDRKNAAVLPEGVSYRFAGNYENQLRADARMMLILPLVLFVIFVVIYMQLKDFIPAFLVFTGIAVAWAGGFVFIWLYSTDWFMNFSFLGANMRELLHIHPVNMSVAVWVGFLALFGIANNDGILIQTYIKEVFKDRTFHSIEEIRSCIISAGSRRIRPCLMTTATTVLALIPVLTSTGRGADIMIPMCLPIFGGMLFQVMTMLKVPVIYSFVEEMKFKLRRRRSSAGKVSE